MTPRYYSIAEDDEPARSPDSDTDSSSGSQSEGVEPDITEMSQSLAEEEALTSKDKRGVRIPGLRLRSLGLETAKNGFEQEPAAGGCEAPVLGG